LADGLAYHLMLMARAVCTGNAVLMVSDAFLVPVTAVRTPVFSNFFEIVREGIFVAAT
jgi:hypothetical protein